MVKLSKKELLKREKRREKEEVEKKKKKKKKNIETLTKDIKVKKKKKNKKDKKVQVARFAQAETSKETQERVEKILSLKNKPVKFAKLLGELLSLRAGNIVHVFYIPEVEKRILRGTLPWVRHFHTDATEHAFVSIIGFSDSALANGNMAKRLVLGLANSDVINKTGGVLIK
jgi:diaminopimelate epimerase